MALVGPPSSSSGGESNIETNQHSQECSLTTIPLVFFLSGHWRGEDGALDRIDLEFPCGGAMLGSEDLNFKHGFSGKKDLFYAKHCGGGLPGLVTASLIIGLPGAGDHVSRVREMTQLAFSRPLEDCPRFSQADFNEFEVSGMTTLGKTYGPALGKTYGPALGKTYGPVSTSPLPLLATCSPIANPPLPTPHTPTSLVEEHEGSSR